jgi:hypothetical protein
VFLTNFLLPVLPSLSLLQIKHPHESVSITASVWMLCLSYEANPGVAKMNVLDLTGDTSVNLCMPEDI